MRKRIYEWMGLFSTERKGEGGGLKRLKILLLVVFLILSLCSRAMGSSPSKYLNSRLTVLSAKLLQEVSVDIEQDKDYRYKIGLLPLMDVNGEDKEFADYLIDQIIETIQSNPFFDLYSVQETTELWQQLNQEMLTIEQLFQEIGVGLDIPGLLMISLVTHPTKYQVTGLVVNTRTGIHRSIELMDLEKSQIAQLAYRKTPVEKIELPTIIDQQNPENDDLNQLPINQITADDASSDNSTELLPELDQTDGILPSEVEESEIVVLPPKTVANSPLKLATTSPMLDNLFLGFDLGDVDGDGLEELVYSGGNYLEVRDLSDYTILWTKFDYLPLSNDHKVLTVDLDKDGLAEVISHGNLVELVDDQLVSSNLRFISRPVTLYGQSEVALFDDGIVYIVNYQGLIQKKYSLGEGYGKRFVFADLNNDGALELVTTMQGEDEGATIQVFDVAEKLENPRVLDELYGFAIQAADFNENGLPEIYLRRNYFHEDRFLYSKIYILESKDGLLQLIGESQPLDYFIVDFSLYPKTQPTRLVVGGMYLKHKRQAITEIKSRLFFYRLEF